MRVAERFLPGTAGTVVDEYRSATDTAVHQVQRDEVLRRAEVLSRDERVGSIRSPRSVVTEARDEDIEPFPSGGEIDNRGEYGGMLVEEECTRFSAANTAFCKNLICPSIWIE